MRATRWLRLALGGIVTAAGLGLGAAPPAFAAVPVLVLDGTGWGHGVGLSQWGAEHLAGTGLTTYEILGTFYPGVGLGEATGPMRVSVHRPGVSTTTLSFPQGGEVRSAREGEQAPGFPVRVGPGGQVRIAYDGAHRVTALVTGQASSPATPFQQDCTVAVLCPPTTEPPSPSAAPSSTTPAAAGSTATSRTPVVAVPTRGGVTTVDERGRSYRGAIEADGAGGLRLRNLVDVEDYLRGMAEVPSTWPAAAVQAQTIAARTYALRAMRTSGEICDDARCQVYVGATAESPGQDAAVAATARQVLTYDGQLAAAVYSADAGGVSATTMEGFGTPDGVYPYLRAVPYDTDNPLPWHVSISLDDLRRRFGYGGAVSGARVSEVGPSGRALQVTIEGDRGDKVVDGRSFARSLGLRSTRFTAKAGMSDGMPPASPAPVEAIQALPEETAEAARVPADAGRGPGWEQAAPSADLDDSRGLPDALEPRRHLASVVAIVLVAFVAGAQLPLALARPGRRMRASTGGGP